MTHGDFLTGLLNFQLHVHSLAATHHVHVGVHVPHDNYPDSHRFMQDNDPKHTSKKAADFFSQENVNWWKTLNPDMSPIENLWHELKEYIRREIKPRNKSQLIVGIKHIWNTVDVQ